MSDNTNIHWFHDINCWNPEYHAELGGSEVAAALGLTLFVVGYGLGLVGLVGQCFLQQRQPQLIAIGTKIGDNILRTNAHIHWHAHNLCSSAIRSHLRKELWNAACVPVSYRSAWFTRLATGGATLTDGWSPSKQTYAIGI